ncbi:J domain-containing protein [Hyphococcus sp.]|uniref:J domain-containing protein n=1 Tax=Hyphococcus sp. TaxID=2038636 RepID=UPI003D0980EA
MSSADCPHIAAMPRENYKPRLGFDIRVKPPGRQKKTASAAQSGEDPATHDCVAPDCESKAACSLPKSPREPRERIWLCMEHAREHNRSWNYFDGLSEDEAKKVREASQYGDRPTWSMGKNDRARAAANARGPADMHDSFGVFGKEAKVQADTRGQYRGGKRLTKLQINAFETMALPFDAPAGDIRRRYAELVRRFHPDSNGGDRSAEQQLSEVVKAHQILKKAQFL